MSYDPNPNKISSPQCGPCNKLQKHIVNSSAGKRNSRETHYNFFINSVLLPFIDLCIVILLILLLDHLICPFLSLKGHLEERKSAIYYECLLESGVKALITCLFSCNCHSESQDRYSFPLPYA